MRCDKLEVDTARGVNSRSDSGLVCVPVSEQVWGDAKCDMEQDRGGREIDDHCDCVDKSSESWWLASIYVLLVRKSNNEQVKQGKGVAECMYAITSFLGG